MKKTPADFATSPAYKAVNAIVAVTALTGIIGSMTPKAAANDQDQPTYNAETQKNQIGAMTNLFTNTNGNVQTSSKTYSGQYAPSADDNNSYTDSDN